MPPNPYDWIPDSNGKLHLAAAAAIRRNPVLVLDALATLNRWTANERTESRFSKKWRELLLNASDSKEGLDRLLQLLEDDSEDAEQMKSYSPMATILDCETIDRVYEPRATSAIS